MDSRDLEVGQVVQLDPEKCHNRAFGACFMIVTEPKSWGAQGYIQVPGDKNGEPGGQAYYRASWEEMEPVAIHAVWMTGDGEPSGAGGGRTP